MISQLFMAVSLTLTLPRWGERSEGGEAEQSNRYANFKLGSPS